MRLPEIINPKNLAVSALLSAITPIAIKNGNLTYSDWISIFSLTTGAIFTLVSQIKESKILTSDDIRKFINLAHQNNEISNQLISKTIIDSDIFVYLNELYLCTDPMFIVDATTHELEWVNSAGAAQLQLIPGKPLPPRDLRMYWRPSDYEQLQELLCNLKYGKALIHEYEAAFITPLDWRENTAQFKLVELNNGQIKRISRTIGTPRKKEIPIDMRYRQSQLC